MDGDIREGPIYKKIITCDGCKYLKKAKFTFFDKYPYKCFHDDIIINNLNVYNLMKGDICPNKITPFYCPYLIKVERNEKIKEIQKKK